MLKGNLLIVDDEPLLLSSLKVLLGGHADQIFTAENGKEGLAILNVYDVHCIISDIKMPVMDGVEFLRTYRAQEGEKPFIFYTAHGNEDLMREAIKFGAFDFLDKPNFNGLEEVVCRGLKVGTTANDPGPIDVLEGLGDEE